MLKNEPEHASTAYASDNSPSWFLVELPPILSLHSDAGLMENHEKIEHRSIYSLLPVISTIPKSS